jgi:hypothetical protein
MICIYTHDTLWSSGSFGGSVWNIIWKVKSLLRNYLDPKGFIVQQLEVARKLNIMNN